MADTCHYTFVQTPKMYNTLGDCHMSVQILQLWQRYHSGKTCWRWERLGHVWGRGIWEISIFCYEPKTPLKNSLKKWHFSPTPWRTSYKRTWQYPDLWKKHGPPSRVICSLLCQSVAPSTSLCFWGRGRVQCTYLITFPSSLLDWEHQGTRGHSLCIVLSFDSSSEQAR